MPNEHKKDFNAMLNNSKGMPLVKILTSEDAIKRFGGSKMLIAPPIDYDLIAKRIPKGKVVTMNQVRDFLAKQHRADFTCPLTAGIFITIAAWASEQRPDDKTPYWRVLKTNGELNAKYPGGAIAQKEKLEDEGHKIITKGRTSIKYFVENYQCDLQIL